MSNDTPVATIPETTEKKDDIPTVEQVLQQALKADLAGIVILGVSKEKDKRSDLYFAASKAYNNPADCFWLMSEGMDAVKAMVRAQNRPKPSVIATPRGVHKPH